MPARPVRGPDERARLHHVAYREVHRGEHVIEVEEEVVRRAEHELRVGPRRLELERQRAGGWHVHVARGGARRLSRQREIVGVEVDVIGGEHVPRRIVVQHEHAAGIAERSETSQVLIRARAVAESGAPGRAGPARRHGDARRALRPGRQVAAPPRRSRATFARSNSMESFTARRVGVASRQLVTAARRDGCCLPPSTFSPSTFHLPPSTFHLPPSTFHLTSSTAPPARTPPACCCTSIGIAALPPSATPARPAPRARTG